MRRGLVYGAVPVLIALGSVVALAPPGGAELKQLPALSTPKATPSLLKPGEQLLIEGDKLPFECATGRLLAFRLDDPGRELGFGFDKNMGAGPWRIAAVALHLPPLGDPRVSSSVAFEPGDYGFKIHCANGAAMDTYETTLVVKVDVNAPTQSTTTTLPPTTTSSSNPSSSSSSSSSSSTSSSSTSSTTAVDITTGTVTPSTAKPAATEITLRGGGFKAAQQLQITLNSTPMALGTTTSNTDGLYATTLVLPANAPAGAHTVTVTGTGADDKPRATSVALQVEKVACGDFATQAAAQEGLGPDDADPHGLDPDDDGRACETGGVVRVAASAPRAGPAPAPVASNAGGVLPRTGAGQGALAASLALCALALGALFVGLSHPVVPAGPSHHRTRILGRARWTRSARPQEAAEGETDSRAKSEASDADAVT